MLLASPLEHLLAIFLDFAVIAVELPRALHHTGHGATDVLRAPEGLADQAVEHLSAPLVLLVANRALAAVHVIPEDRVAGQNAAARVAGAPSAMVSLAQSLLLLLHGILLLAVQALDPLLGPALVLPARLPAPLFLALIPALIPQTCSLLLLLSSRRGPRSPWRLRSACGRRGRRYLHGLGRSRFPGSRTGTAMIRQREASEEASEEDRGCKRHEQGSAQGASCPAPGAGRRKASKEPG